MKRLITVLAIFSLAACNWASTEQRLGETICKEFSGDAEGRACRLQGPVDSLINNVRKLLQEGDEAKGIPSFDPLIVPSLNLAPSSNLLSGVLELTNLTVQGVPDFVVEEACLELAGLINYRLTLRLLFNEIVLTAANYTGNIKLFDMLNVYGTGNARITATAFRINAVAGVRLGQPLEIRTLDVALVIPAIDVKLTGLLDDEFMSDIISRQLSDTLTTLAKEEEERINNLVNALLKQIIETPSKNLKELPNQDEIAQSQETCYALVAAVEQMTQILTENDLMSLFFNKLFQLN